MRPTKIIAALMAFALGLILSGCGGAATSSNTNSAAPANKTNVAAPTNASPATAAPAKQGTPPKADFTLKAEDLLKDYKALLDKDPKSVGAKYENKNIQFSGKITRLFSSELGSGTVQNVVVSGDGKEDDATCIFEVPTEESKKLATGQTVTLQGTQTNNYNMPPTLYKCFVIKGAE